MYFLRACITFSPPEDAELSGGGEGSLRIFQAQQVLAVVQALVDVGMGLELESLVLPG